MKIERWQQIDDLLQAALQRAPADRPAFLAEACVGDDPLRREVESLLAHHEQSENFLDEPLSQVAAELLVKKQAPLEEGQTIDHYKVLARLGAGGMGEVYLAEDTRLGRRVALKLLPSRFTNDQDRLRRFEQEARAASALSHPNIITIYEIGKVDDLHYIATEYIDGPTLREVLTPGPMTTKKMLQVAAQAAGGLARAHAAGIVHRDLKPENIMITRDGVVKIVDFGLAKLAQREAKFEDAAETFTAGKGTEPGLIIGTAGYMSPEQASGLPADFRSDQFSLGVILYEMASGNRAFQRPTMVETLSAIIRDEPEPVTAVNQKSPAPLRWIIERCLAKSAEDRYASTLDLARELESLRDHLSEIEGPDAPRPAVAGISAPARRYRAFAAIAVAAGILAALIGGFFLGRGAREPVPTFRQLTFGHGTITGARFAADGQTVIYGASWVGRTPELYTTQPGSPESRSLGLLNAGIWSVSSSGEMAIAQPCTLNWSSCMGTLARVPPAGGAPREILVNVHEADWAPDGKNLAVAQFAQGKDRLQYPLGNVLYETPGWVSYLRVSPKGDMIAFLDHPILGGIDGSVCVVDLAGKKKTLLSGRQDLKGLAWSSTGDEIWFTGSRAGDYGLYAITLSGRERAVLRFPGRLFILDISRGGQRVLLRRAMPRAVMIGLAPGEQRERDLSWFDYSTVADLSSDGRTLLFYEWGVGSKWSRTVYLRKTDGSDAIRLGEGKPLTLSPDGKWALAVRQTAPPELVLLPTGPGEQKLLPRGSIGEYAHWAAWSPDGGHIFFAAAEPGRRIRTYFQDIQGGLPHPVTSEGMVGTLLSPDGKLIAAVDDRHRGYYLCPVAGGEPEPLEGYADGDRLLQWSGDGRSLFLRGAEDMELKIYKLDLASGRREFWKELTPPYPAGLIDLASDPGLIRLTPDGKSYVYTYWTAVSELYVAEGLK